MNLSDFLAANTETRSFEKGALIFSEGEQAEAAYYLVEGEVEIFQGGEASSLMAVLGVGDIFGEMALLRFDKYTLSARAVGDVKVYVLQPDMLHDQIKQTHPLIKVILDMLMDRVHEVNKILIDLDQTNKA